LSTAAAKDRDRVIVVENTDDAREVLVHTFLLRGVLALGVASCSEAKTVMKSERFKVAILDLGMPDTDGLTCAGQMKLFDPGLHLFAFTAYDEAAKPDSMLRDAGFDACFRKGSDEEKLLAAVARCYGQVEPPLAGGDAAPHG
jgi:CheY-like chemotaxis protein